MKYSLKIAQKALIMQAIDALTFADNYIEIEPHEHTSSDQADAHKELRECIENLNEMMACIDSSDDAGVIIPKPIVSKSITESTKDNAKKYFSYDPYDDFELYDTEEEAKAAAQRVLDRERAYACEGWSEYVDKICWGEVRQHVAETMNRPRTDADYGDSEFDTVVDYGLVDVCVMTEDQPHGIKEQE